MELGHAVLTGHARDQLSARNLSEAECRRVLEAPDAVVDVRPGRVVAQRVVSSDTPPQDYLLRVFVDVDREPPEVVTAYRTSKIDKYRSRP